MDEPRLTDDDLRVIARLLDDEQAHKRRDQWSWGPNGVDRARWLGRVRRVRRKVAAVRDVRKPAGAPSRSPGWVHGCRTCNHPLSLHPAGPCRATSCRAGPGGGHCQAFVPPGQA